MTLFYVTCTFSFTFLLLWHAFGPVMLQINEHDDEGDVQFSV